MEPATQVQAVDWESNPRPPGLKAYGLTTEPRWPGHWFHFWRRSPLIVRCSFEGWFFGNCLLTTHEYQGSGAHWFLGKLGRFLKPPPASIEKAPQRGWSSELYSRQGEFVVWNAGRK